MGCSVLIELDGLDPPKHTAMQSLRHKPRVDFPVKVTIPEQAPRRKKPTVTAIGGPRKKPMLIRNLGGAGAAKSECLDAEIVCEFVLITIV